MAFGADRGGALEIDMVNEQLQRAVGRLLLLIYLWRLRCVRTGWVLQILLIYVGTRDQLVSNQATSIDSHWIRYKELRNVHVSMILDARKQQLILPWTRLRGRFGITGVATTNITVTTQSVARWGCLVPSSELLELSLAVYLR
jgi:hypothetical protein